MLDRVQLRIIADYLAATRNEIAFDEMYLRKARLDPEKVGFIPRVPKWFGLVGHRHRWFKIVWCFGRVFWLAGGALAFFLYEFVKFDWLRRVEGNPQHAASVTSEGMVLELSERTSKVVDSARFSGLPSTWLTCPWVCQQPLPKNTFKVSLMSLVTRGDLIAALDCALRATYILAHCRIHSRWVLQSYTAFRWFLVRRVVDRLSGKLVIVEHFDRWAILVDRSTRAQRLKRGCTHSLLLLQHGTLVGPEATPLATAWLRTLPTRLTCVDELYTYNSQEERVFREAVLVEKPSKRGLRVFYFTPTITLSGELSIGKPRLLFVGHPLCEVFHEAVYCDLRKMINFEAYYKPHPTVRASKSIYDVGWTVIEDPVYFPRVELLISYPSTLVLEYRQTGVSTLVHLLDARNDELSSFLEQALVEVTKFGLE